MTILEAILQGLIQGVTEFLPVSSSGHLSLFQHFFGVSGDEAVFTTIALHIGTLIAVFIAFRQKIWALILEAFVHLLHIQGLFLLRGIGQRHCSGGRMLPLHCCYPFYRRQALKEEP